MDKQTDKQTCQFLTEVSPPLPVHVSLAGCPGAVEVARGTCGLVHDGRGLEPIGQDDVGVHGPHVQVVDHGVLQAVRHGLQIQQLLGDVRADLVQVGHMIQGDLLLLLDGVGHSATHVVSQLLTLLLVLRMHRK